jgi:hypothetical protein
MCIIPPFPSLGIIIEIDGFPRKPIATWKGAFRSQNQSYADLARGQSNWPACYGLERPLRETPILFLDSTRSCFSNVDPEVLHDFLETNDQSQNNKVKSRWFNRQDRESFLPMSHSSKWKLEEQEFRHAKLHSSIFVYCEFTSFQMDDCVSQFSMKKKHKCLCTFTGREIESWWAVWLNSNQHNSSCWDIVQFLSPERHIFRLGSRRMNELNVTLLGSDSTLKMVSCKWKICTRVRDRGFFQFAHMRGSERPRTENLMLMQQAQRTGESCRASGSS